MQFCWMSHPFMSGPWLCIQFKAADKALQANSDFWATVVEGLFFSFYPCKHINNSPTLFTQIHAAWWALVACSRGDSCIWVFAWMGTFRVWRNCAGIMYQFLHFMSLFNKNYLLTLQLAESAIHVKSNTYVPSFCLLCLQVILATLPYFIWAKDHCLTTT